MKKLKNYVNSMYPPAFLVLCAGLTFFSVTLCLLAVSLRSDMLAGESDVIYRYPKLIEKIVFSLYILLPVTFAVDTKERSKRKS